MFIALAADKAVGGGSASKSASEKRTMAKAINSEKFDKLDVGSQRAVKALRRAKGDIDACVEAILSGKKPNPELVEACASVQIHAAKVMLS